MVNGLCLFFLEHDGKTGIVLLSLQVINYIHKSTTFNTLNEAM